jgi:anti-sigma factor RsiW
LESALGEQVEAHLAACAECRAELSRAQAARERIAVFGAQSAKDVEAVDLWPALDRRLRTERALPSVRKSPRSTMLRRVSWLALPLAAAAALLMTLDLGQPSDVAPNGVDSAAPGAPALATNAAAAAEGESTSAQPGGLRRAGPGDERLRDSSRELDGSLRTRLRPVGPAAGNSLAGDDTELR